MSSAGGRLELREVGDDGLTEAERILLSYRWMAGEGSKSLEPCEGDVCRRLRGQSLADRLMSMQGGAEALAAAERRREQDVARYERRLARRERWWHLHDDVYWPTTMFLAVCVVILAIILVVQG